MQSTVALITGLVVLVHSAWGCCAHEWAHPAMAAHEASHGEAGNCDHSEGDRPGGEHACTHLACQWAAPSGADRVDAPRPVLSAVWTVESQCCAAGLSPAYFMSAEGAARDVAPALRRHLALGVLVV